MLASKLAFEGIAGETEAVGSKGVFVERKAIPDECT